MSALTGPPRRVLVVEDDPGVARAMLWALEDAGYAVGHAAEGNAALRWLEAWSPPDAILVDLVMPGMDGPTLIRHLAADPRWSSVPVIVASAAPAADSRLEPGTYRSFLRKPFDLDELIVAVADAVGNRPA